MVCRYNHRVLRYVRRDAPRVWGGRLHSTGCTENLLHVEPSGHQRRLVAGQLWRPIVDRLEKSRDRLRGGRSLLWWRGICLGSQLSSESRTEERQGHLHPWGESDTERYRICHGVAYGRGDCQHDQARKRSGRTPFREHRRRLLRFRGYRETDRQVGDESERDPFGAWIRDEREDAMTCHSSMQSPIDFDSNSPVCGEPVAARKILTAMQLLLSRLLQDTGDSSRLDERKENPSSSPERRLPTTPLSTHPVQCSSEKTTSCCLEAPHPRLYPHAITSEASSPSMMG